MTFSIVARCARTGELGVGAVTAMPAVGKLVAHVRARAGAAATQATVNPYLAIDGLRLLAEGHSAGAALDEVLSSDPGHRFRQAGLVDSQGRVATFTGSQTPDWSGDLTADGCTAQGNRLVGPETLEAVIDAFGKRDDVDLAERLLVALEAGEATGADRQGAMSATITVHASEDYPLWDIRVDHAEDPVAVLRELYGEFREGLLPQVRMLSTRDDMMGEAARQQIQEIC